MKHLNADVALVADRLLQLLRSEGAERSLQPRDLDAALAVAASQLYSPYFRRDDPEQRHVNASVLGAFVSMIAEEVWSAEADALAEVGSRTRH